MTVIEVAYACGFPSPPHFSKRYHSLFGLSPSSERTCEPVQRAVRGRRQVFVPDELPAPEISRQPVSSAEVALLVARGEATYGTLGHAMVR